MFHIFLLCSSTFCVTYCFHECPCKGKNVLFTSMERGCSIYHIRYIPSLRQHFFVLIFIVFYIIFVLGVDMLMKQNEAISKQKHNASFQNRYN